MRRFRIPFLLVFCAFLLGAGMSVGAAALGSAAVPRAAAADHPAPAGRPAARRPAKPAAPHRAEQPLDARPALSNVPGHALALTIDDGPDPVWTPRMLDLLAAHGVTATFCLVGQQAARYPELVRRIVAAGHTLCNHSLRHDNLSHVTAAQAGADLDRTNALIEQAAGVRPALFRAPYGAWSPTLLAAARARGMTPLGWDIDPRDWARPGTAAIIAALERAGAGNIVLVHDGGGNRAQTIAALTRVLPDWQAAGLRLRTP